MTLEEVSNTLPNGFHDATLNELNISYAARRITLRLKVFVGLPGDHPEFEPYREPLVAVTLENFQYCIIEPPVGSPVLDEHDLSTVDDRQWESDNESLPKLGEGMFRFSFYAFNWMASIHLAAEAASMTFDDADDELYVQRIMTSLR